LSQLLRTLRYACMLVIANTKRKGPSIDYCSRTICVVVTHNKR
jgi:hypothetical protein